MNPLLVIGLGALAFVVFRPAKKPAPPNPNLKPLPGKTVTPKFRELKRESVMTWPVGATWLLEADVPFFAESLVTKEKVISGLRDRGLLPIRVDEKRPGYWPVLSEADWYVVANNTDKTKQVELPSPVERVWEAIA